MNGLPKPAYILSGPHLSGHRVVLGYEVLSDAQKAHEVLAHPAHEAGEVEAMKTAIMTIVGAVRDYLPPVGTSDATLISAVIEAVDNPSINPVIRSIENGRS